MCIRPRSLRILRRLFYFLSTLFPLLALGGCGVGVVSAATNAAQQPSALVFLGAYNPGSAYVPNNVVIYQGSSYVALANSTNVAPSGASLSSTDWVMLAEAGAPGATGSQGLQGAVGAAGPMGKMGATGSAGATGVQGPAGIQGLKGDTGANGAPGVAGPTGVAGLQGPAGPIGLTGLAGPPGASGAAGPAGAAGMPGSQGPTGPAGPAGPVGPQGPAGQAAHGGSLAGRRLGVLGDSISSYLYGNAWQNVVVGRTGMSLTVQDARPGRRFDQAFECWGNPSVGGSVGSFHASYAYVTTGGTCGFTSVGLTDGMVFADSLANVDMEIVELSTNDQSVPLGQPGDATNAGTFYGNMRWVVETYLAAKPSLRLVLVTLQYNSLAPSGVTQQYANAMVAYGSSIGVPVINMYTLGGANAITLSTLTRDGIHPSDFGFANVYGPVIAQGVEAIF